MFKLPHNCTHFTCQQSNTQNPSCQASIVHEARTSKCTNCIQKSQRNQRSNCQHTLGHQKSNRIPLKKKSTSLTTLKPFTVWITTHCGKFLKRQEYQTILPASCETYMLVKMQQLQPDMEQLFQSNNLDWFQIGKGVCQGYMLSPCLFDLYAEYIMKMPGWMKHKLASRFLGEISITSDMHLIPP